MARKGRLTVRGENGVLPTRARSVAVAACAALALAAAGCGSSGSTTTITTPGTAAAKSKTATSSGLKVASSTPKYASPSSSEPVKSGVVQIAYRNIAIDPDTVRAKVGSTIKWTNEDPEKCNVTSEGGGPYKFASKDFGEGGSFELKLDKPGVIHYECTSYPTTMNGTIEVVE
jgi:plastocyanin